MADILQSLIDFFRNLVPWFLAFSALLTIGFAFGIIYVILSMRKLTAATKAKDEADQPLTPTATAKEKPTFKAPEGNARWERIAQAADSENPNDWRLAIIEADVILDEMMSKMGYHGKDLGERLKSVEPSDFTTIEQAWEAHKIRNRIAHMGGSYQINQREARRVIDLYKQVFKEFEFI
jgi:hypothetical protein